MSKHKRRGGIPLASIIIIVLGLIYFIGGFIYIKVRDAKAERESVNKKEKSNYAGPRYDNEVTQLADESTEETEEVSIPMEQAAKETPPKPVIQKPKEIKTKVRTPYEQGYGDGYECGYDDANQNAGYGYSWYCDGKSEDYLEGFMKGYRLGYAEGREDYEAFNDEY